jgi:hypothetical protein
LPTAIPNNGLMVEAHGYLSLNRPIPQKAAHKNQKRQTHLCYFELIHDGKV